MVSQQCVTSILRFVVGIVLEWSSSSKRSIEHASRLHRVHVSICNLGFADMSMSTLQDLALVKCFFQACPDSCSDIDTMHVAGGHNVVMEIQATIPSNPTSKKENPTLKPMMVSSCRHYPLSLSFSEPCLKWQSFMQNQPWEQ